MPDRPRTLTRPQRMLAALIMLLGAAAAPLFFTVMFLTVNDMLGPYFDGWAWTVPVATEITFVLLFLLAVLFEWIGRPRRALWLAPYPFAVISAFLQVSAAHGSIPAMAGHLAVTMAFFVPVTFAKTAVRTLLVSDAERTRALALADAKAHARDILRSALGVLWRWRTPVLLRRQLRSGRLPAKVLEAVDNGARFGGASVWEPVVEAWIAAAVALPERAAEALRAARAEPARSMPDGHVPDTAAGVREARQETPLEPAPEHASGMPETALQARPARASKPALKLTAARSRSMSPDKLAEHVAAMLDEYGDVSLNRIKTDLSVGTEKAKEALEIARSNRARVIPIGERRQA
jgi:hypothetical protein